MSSRSRVHVDLLGRGISISGSHIEPGIVEVAVPAVGVRVAEVVKQVKSPSVNVVIVAALAGPGSVRVKPTLLPGRVIIHGVAMRGAP
jgi:hypothetical protein